VHHVRCVKTHYHLRFSRRIVLALPLKLELRLIVFFLHQTNSCKPKHWQQSVTVTGTNKPSFGRTKAARKLWEAGNLSAGFQKVVDGLCERSLKIYWENW